MAEDVAGADTYDCEGGGEEKEIVGEDRSEVKALIAAWRHGGCGSVSVGQIYLRHSTRPIP